MPGTGTSAYLSGCSFRVFWAIYLPAGSPAAGPTWNCCWYCGEAGVVHIHQTIMHMTALFKFYSALPPHTRKTMGDTAQFPSLVGCASWCPSCCMISGAAALQNYCHCCRELVRGDGTRKMTIIKLCITILKCNNDSLF